jgi:DNA-damage-inducible protein D
MKAEQVQMLTETFEGHAQQTEGGVDDWLARDVQHLLGYAEWHNTLLQRGIRPGQTTKRPSTSPTRWTTDHGTGQTATFASCGGQTVPS